MNAASLMVRIGADVEEFTHGMSKAEKAAKKGFAEIGEAAAKMTEFFSIEFALAAGEFAHLAAEAQDASARMDRVFGSAAREMKEQLEGLTKTIPETVAELQNLAVKSDNLLQGLGYGAEKAADMSIEMVKLAGDMAAFARVPIGDALDALDRGLAGKTKGLLQFGIAIKEQEIHQEAMKRGLIDNHRVLTQLGTAEIVESLIRERATRITGEAARTAGQASNSFRFLKASAEEMGVSIGNIVLPPVIAIVTALKRVTDAVEHTSTGVKTFVLSVGAVVAAVGPAVLIITRFAKELIVLQRAMALFAAGEGIAAIIGGFAAAPVAVAIAAIAAITAAIGGLYLGVKKLWDLADGTSGEADADAAARANDAAYMAAIRKRHAKMAEHAEAAKGALSIDNRSPLDQFKSRSDLAEYAFNFAKQYQAPNGAGGLDTGLSMTSAMERVNKLHDEAVGLLAKEKGAWTDMAKAAGEAIIKTEKMQELIALAKAMANGRGLSSALADGGMNQTEVNLSVAGSAQGQTDSLRVREAALRMKDTFDVAREAAVSLGLRFRDIDHVFGVALKQFTAQWNDPKTSAMSGLEEGATQLLAGFTPAALAAQAFGKVMQGLQPIIDSLMGPFVALGQIVALIARPVMLPLFQALKFFGIATALVGEVVYSVAGAIARVVGNLVVAIGKFISKIPFLGGTGNGIQDFGNNLLNAANSMQNTAAELDNARRQLQDLNIDNAANGINALGSAAAAAANSLLNVPQGFKLALEQYRAQNPVTPIGPPGSKSTGAGTHPTGSGRPVSDSTPIVLTLDGKVLARATIGHFRNAAQRDLGDSTRWPELMTV